MLLAYSVKRSYYSHITKEQVLEKMNLAINDATALNISWQQFKIPPKSQLKNTKPQH